MEETIEDLVEDLKECSENRNYFEIPPELAGELYDYIKGLQNARNGLVQN